MFKFRSAILSAVIGTCLVVGAVGCHHGNDKKSDTPWMNDSQMSRMQMMRKGDKLMGQGEQMKIMAEKMNDNDMMDGMTKQQLLDKGEKMMREGQMTKAKAEKM